MEPNRRYDKRDELHAQKQRPVRFLRRSGVSTPDIRTLPFQVKRGQTSASVAKASPS